MLNRRQFLVASSSIPIASTFASASESLPDSKLSPWLSIHVLRERIAKGGATSVGATELMLDRIKSLERLDAYLHIDEQGALDDAKRADTATKNGQNLGPLHGVPIAVKDLLDARGMPTTAGSRALPATPAQDDSTVVARLRRSGAVLLGKLANCEGAMIGYHPEFPVPSNPWDADVWAGASSSGSGIASAAGLAYGTIGTDTGGSIRTPAASCGVVGLKPSWGRVSRNGVVSLASSMDHIGPIARCVKDCALMLDVISGRDAQDSSTVLDQTSIFDKLNQPIHGLRVGWSERFVSDGIDPELSRSLISARSQFEALGAEIVDINVPDFTSYGRDWVTICSAEAVIACSKWYPNDKEKFGPGFRRWLERGERVTTSEYVESTVRRRACISKLNRMLAGVDGFISPAMDGPPFPINREDGHGEYPDWVYERVPARHTIIHNFNGSPTLTLPCGKTGGGLPLALQLVGKVGGELEICRLGQAYENATEHHKVRPPIG